MARGGGVHLSFQLCREAQLGGSQSRLAWAKSKFPAPKITRKKKK
jgi:hypothetical protein